MPGSGKSSLGRYVADSLHMEFLDTDVLIERHEKRPITEIFKTDGEPYFRRVETSVIGVVAQAVREIPAGERKNNGLVLSVGGGAAENPANIDLMRGIGRLVYIERPLEALEKDISYNGNRPLLSDRERLVELFTRRAPIYRAATDLSLTNDGSFEKAAETLLAMVRMMGAEANHLVIGDPIGHSLSPKLHSAIYAEIASNPALAMGGDNLGGPCEAGTVTGIADASYGAVRVAPAELEEAMRCVRCGGVKGLNVTIPHKKAIIPYLDEIAGDATVAEAVNTVVNRSGKLVGYNTDMEGLRYALESRGVSYGGAVVSVCGTGGAAAGIVCKAAECGASEIIVIGRNGEKADAIFGAAGKLAAGSDGAGGLKTTFVSHDFERQGLPGELGEALARTDLLVNATPLGMGSVGRSFADFSFLDGLKKTAFVYDIVYDPPETALLCAAKERGIRAESGLSMLICQGILSDELFFGVELDRKELFKAIRDKFRIS
jgi:shikimate dehydrogenase